jgi:hypothetical protein
MEDHLAWLGQMCTTPRGARGEHIWKGVLTASDGAHRGDKVVHWRGSEEDSPGSDLLNECYLIGKVQGCYDQATLSSGGECFEELVISFKITTPVQDNDVDRMLCAPHALNEWENLIWLRERGKDVDIINGCQEGMRRVGKEFWSNNQNAKEPGWIR